MVREHTAHLGQEPRRRFRGHLTLARLKPHADLPRAMGAYAPAEQPTQAGAPQATATSSTNTDVSPGVRITWVSASTGSPPGDVKLRA